MLKRVCVCMRERNYILANEISDHLASSYLHCKCYMHQCRFRPWLPYKLKANRQACRVISNLSTTHDNGSNKDDALVYMAG